MAVIDNDREFDRWMQRLEQRRAQSRQGKEGSEALKNHYLQQYGRVHGA